MIDFVAKHVRDVPFSGIRRFFDLASSTEGVISLGVGEPDFFTPWNVREEAIYNIEKKRSVYSANAGIVELRNQISNYLNRTIAAEYPPDRVIVTVGVSEALDIALRAVVNPGDEVLVHEPSFVAYKACVAFAHGVPVPIDTRPEDDFRLTPETLKRAITPKTKAIILSYPNNPTGGVMGYDDIAAVADVLRDKDILVLSDEVYSELTYGQKHVSIASFPGMYEKTIVLNGFSKAFAMTGWRIGYAAVGNPDVYAAMLKIHQYAIMCAPTVAQNACIEALKNGRQSVNDMRDSFNARRRIVVKGFNDVGMPTFEPKGAFYVFPSIRHFGMTSATFCERLLNEEKVAIVPGDAFGASGEGFVRVSYAYSIDSLKAALEKINRFTYRIAQ